MVNRRDKIRFMVRLEGTCPLIRYWHCCDKTIHYKYNEAVNFCGFRCVTMSPITVFYELCFFTFINLYQLPKLSMFNVQSINV